MTRRRGGGGGRGEGGGNEGECGNAPKLSSPSVLSSELYRHSVVKKHLIVACLVTSKFREAKMTSSLSRLVFCPKKKIYGNYGSRGCALLAFWLVIYPVLLGTLTPLLPGTLNVILTWYTD